MSSALFVRNREGCAAGCGKLRRKRGEASHPTAACTALSSRTRALSTLFSSTLLHITLVLVYSTLSPRRDRTATIECSTLYASVSRVVRFVSPLLSAPLRSFGISAAKSRAERSGSDRRASRNAMSHRRRRVAVAVAFDVDVVRFSRAFALSETKL